MFKGDLVMGLMVWSLMGEEGMQSPGRVEFNWVCIRIEVKVQSNRTLLFFTLLCAFHVTNL